MGSGEGGWQHLKGDLLGWGYGVFEGPGGQAPRVGVAVGDDGVLDLAAACHALAPGYAGLFRGGSLDPLLGAGPETWAGVRDLVAGWLAAGPSTAGHPRVVDDGMVVPRSQVRMLLPFTVADYADFFSGEQHAINAGRIFRPGQQDPLPANWRHLPVGYHGRAGTVVVSGTPVRRPSGQRRGQDGTIGFGPSAALDFEAEIGFVVGTASPQGDPVPLTGFSSHVFGICLVNDWSARDIQRWESTPLGPFLGKSFATSVSPWVVPLDVLSAARVRPPRRDPRPLPYLDDLGTPPWGLDLMLEIRLNGHLISRPPFATMYWTGAQQLAHLTVNGAAVRTGDLFASGTVSGPDRDQWGSLLELSWNGQQPLQLPDGSTRTFLADGDEVSISATAPGPGGGVLELGTVTGQVTPAR